MREDPASTGLKHTHMNAQRGDVLRSPKRVRWHRRRKDSTLHQKNLTKEILWAEHARFRGKQTLNQRVGTLMLATVCVAFPEILVDGFRRAQLCHHAEARGRRWRACTQIPRQTTCCKKKARMYLRERAQKDVHVSSKPSKDLKASVSRNERATPRDPALSSDSAVRRANLEAAGGAL